MSSADRGSGEREGLTQPASPSCDEVRDLLPLLGPGPRSSSFANVELHLRDCSECRAEAEFVMRLGELRPEPPISILQGVLGRAAERDLPTAPESRVDGEHGVHWRGVSWSLAAAAVAVLALGVGILSGPDPASDPVWMLALEPEPASWYGDEWMIAGGPVPEALSDDILRALLEEMDQ